MDNKDRLKITTDIVTSMCLSAIKASEVDSPFEVGKRAKQSLQCEYDESFNPYKPESSYSKEFRKGYKSK